MIKLIVEKLPRITKSRKKLERELGVEITNRGREVFIKGKAENEYVAEKVLTALEFGFPFADALALRYEENIFEIINLKEFSKTKNMERVRGRVIGTDGRALKTLTTLTNCAFEIKDNKVAIIGNSENIQNAQQAIISLVQGAKHSNVYAHLEKNQPKPIIDLGLK